MYSISLLVCFACMYKACRSDVMILGGVLKTEPKLKQKTGTGNRGLGSARGSCRVDQNEVARAFKLWSNLVLPA